MAFAVGDVTGHGMHAALVMATLHAGTRAHAASELQPTAVMTRLNQYLDRHLLDDVFVTMVFGLFDPADGSLEYVNAGHPSPLLVCPSGEIRPLAEGRNLMLGVADVSYEADRAVVGPGSSLLVITDGVTETMSPNGEQFGVAGLRRVLEAVPSDSGQELVDAVTQAVTRFRHPFGQEDDVTIFALTRRGPVGA